MFIRAAVRLYSVWSSIGRMDRGGCTFSVVHKVYPRSQFVRSFVRSSTSGRPPSLFRRSGTLAALPRSSHEPRCSARHVRARGRPSGGFDQIWATVQYIRTELPVATDDCRREVCPTTSRVADNRRLRPTLSPRSGQGNPMNSTTRIHELPLLSRHWLRARHAKVKGRQRKPTAIYLIS